MKKYTFVVYMLLWWAICWGVAIFTHRDTKVKAPAPAQGGYHHIERGAE